MSLILNGVSGDQRRDLPASRDRGGDLPLRDNPFNSSAAGLVSGSSLEDEGLVGLYPYSGADIKLVVHLPPEDPRVTNQRLDDAEQELRDLQSALEMASSEEEVTQMEGNLQTLRADLAAVQNLLSITPEGTQEYTDLLSDISDLNDQISSLSSILNTSPRSNERARMQEEIENLTRSIESLRESDGSGPTTRTKVLGEIQTLSISGHREKYPVRPLGTVYPRSYCRGPRTISGSIVFTTFNQHIMSEFLEVSQYRSTGVGDWDRYTLSSYLMDQIPPLDISISFANEYGNLSWMAILGVEFINEGQVMSIEDLYVEGTAQYVARDFDPIRSVANRRLSRTHGVGQSLSGTSIMMEDLRRRVARRNIPWI